MFEDIHPIDLGPEEKVSALFYYPHDNVFIDEGGYEVDVRKILPPWALFLFKRMQEYMCIRIRPHHWIELFAPDPYWDYDENGDPEVIQDCMRGEKTYGEHEILLRDLP